MALPEKFIEQMLRELGGEEGRALCEALDSPSPVSVRLNPAKAAAVEELPDLKGAGDVEWSREGYYLGERPVFTLDPDFHAGAYYVQEASSQFVGHILGGMEMEGRRVLDMCAAPGGKTTLYASLVGVEGLVVANEIDRRRANVLADNVRKWGLGNVAVCSTRPDRFRDLEEWFDVVAVDAPCSGEGMFRKDEAARGEWSENNVKICAARQDEILREAWRTLRPGGVLIYSTCTFNHMEDEGTLERMLEWASDQTEAFDEVRTDPRWGIVTGRVGVFQTFHFYPHRACGEGFFAAVARKSGEFRPRRERKTKNERGVIAPVDKKSAGVLAEWVTEPERMRFVTIGDTCYGWFRAQADAVAMLSERVPVIYSGVAMGQIFKGRLKPDGALAFFVGLNRGAVSVAEVGEQEARAFLRRQDPGVELLQEGINLICCRGRALGFVKRIGARVNNLYPESLRIVNL